MDLKDELELLDELISKILDPKKILQQGIPDVLFKQLNEVTVSEFERIRKRLKQVHYSRDKERLKEQYIQQHQKDIISLMDKTTEYLMPAAPAAMIETAGDNNLVRLYKKIFNCLQELLEFIEKHLSKYFNLDADVPVSYLMLAQAELRGKIKNIKKKFQQNEELKELASIVLGPVSIISGTHEAVSYRKFLYVKEVVNELEEFWNNPRSQLSREANESFIVHLFVELLYYLNFNSSKLSQWLIEKAVSSVNSLHDQRERVGWLYEYLKELNQLQVKPGVKLVSEAAGLKEQLIHWIEEEIYFLEKKETLFSVAPEINATIKDEDKIHFAVPEPVLSLIARSALESKLVTNKIKKRVFEMIAKVVTTPGSDNPKPGALIKKGYDPERQHRDKAIGILHEMIRRIMKY